MNRMCLRKYLSYTLVELGVRIRLSRVKDFTSSYLAVASGSFPFSPSTYSTKDPITTWVGGISNV
jgi:hypothetical protein